MSAKAYFQYFMVNGLILLSFTISAWAIQADSLLLVGFYLIIAGINLLSMVKVYCSKCFAEDNVLVNDMSGKQARIFFKKVKMNFNLREKTLMIFNLLVIVGVPQYWLWQIKVLFGLYWVFTILAAIGILTTICQICKIHRSPF